MDLPALAIKNPEINAVGAFQEAKSTRLNQQAAAMGNAAAAMEMFASGAAYALPQGPGGPVDPDKWNQVLDSYQQMGMDQAKIDELRQRPDLAPVILRGSVNAMNAVRDEALFPLKVQELEANIAQSLAAAQPKAPSPTDDQREYEMAVSQGFKGSFLDFKKAQQSPGTVVNVGPDGATGGASLAQFQKDLGGIMAKDYGSIRDDAKAARSALGSLTMMQRAVEDPNFYSGIGAEQVLALKRFGSALGLDPEGVTSMETFNALNKQAALAAMGGTLGTGFSNADRDFVVEQVPSLANTPEGNKRLIEIQKGIANRKIEIAKMATAYVKKNGVLDAGFEDELAEFAEKNPLFGGASEETGAAQQYDEITELDGKRYGRRGDDYFELD